MTRGWCETTDPHPGHSTEWDSGQVQSCPGIPGWAAAVGLPIEAEAATIAAQPEVCVCGHDRHDIGDVCMVPGCGCIEYEKRPLTILYSTYRSTVNRLVEELAELHGEVETLRDKYDHWQCMEGVIEINALDAIDDLETILERQMRRAALRLGGVVA